jgi:quinol monooxygenase YgiN
MSRYLRLYQSAVDPSDVAEVRRLFNDDVRPLFENLDGCVSMELLINLEPSAGGLVEGCALSRWTSLEHLQQALASREVGEALVRIRTMLRQEPVTKTLEVLE